ncbi:hypothetical protein TSUD_14460 [Trifolium subterraneum]|uniref:Transmembrane protein n=1 Tax=Trifolium subterraneum TaxID=3900 RepID=A0A2Z6NTP6_TRISU|nr:hypothetical protein TSUD_14460 [Trifolium subterraneum]
MRWCDERRLALRTTLLPVLRRRCLHVVGFTADLEVRWLLDLCDGGVRFSSYGFYTGVDVGVVLSSAPFVSTVLVAVLVLLVADASSVVVLVVVGVEMGVVVAAIGVGVVLWWRGTELLMCVLEYITLLVPCLSTMIF